MKMFSVLIAVFLFVGCKEEVTYQTINIKKQYSVVLPSFLTKTNALNPEASLQYQNTNNEFYVMVFDASKKETEIVLESLQLPKDFTSYSDALVKEIKTSLKDSDFSEIENITINGLEARTFSVTGYFEGVHIYYQIAHVQGKEKFYQLLMWTSPSRKEMYSPEMDKIIKSFREFGDRARRNKA